MASFAQLNSREYLSRVSPHGETPPIKETPISILGPETLLHIFSFLDGKSLTNTSKTCRKWQELSTEPSLSHIWENYLLEQFRSPFSNGRKENLFHKEPSWGFNLDSLWNSYDLESLLKDKPYTELEEQIRSRNFTCISQIVRLPYEDGSPFQASFFNDKLYLATKNSLYIFSDLTSGKVRCAKPRETLSKIHVSNDKIYLTFQDGYIRIYQEKDLKKIQSFRMSQDSTSSPLSQEILLSVDKEELLTTTKFAASLMLCSAVSGRAISRLKCSFLKEEIHGILLKNHQIYVRTRQNLQIWDRTSLKIRHFIECFCASPVNFLHVENEKIYVLHQDAITNSLNLATFTNSGNHKSEFTVLEKDSQDINKSPVFKIHNRSLYVAAGPNLKIFDLKRGTLVREVKDIGSSSKISVIEIADKSILLGDMNGKLQKLDFMENQALAKTSIETRKRKEAPV